MLHRHGAYLLLRVKERAIFIELVLEEVRVDCPDADSVFLPKLYDLGRGLARAKIPAHMNRDRRTKTGKRVDLSGAGQLVVDIDCSGILEELAEACPGVGQAPTPRLDSELTGRILTSFGL